MSNKITNIIHGLSDLLKIQEKIKKQADGLTELYSAMAVNFKKQNTKIENNHKAHSDRLHEHDMRLVKLEATLDTLFAVANGQKRVSKHEIKSLDHEE